MSEICSVCKKAPPPTPPVVITPFHCPACNALNFPWTACNGFVFLYPDPPEDHFGPIVLPSPAQEQKPFGTVLSAGKGYYAVDKRTKKQVHWPVEVKAGDRVFYDKDVPWKVLVKAADGYEYPVVLMGDRDITARVEGEVASVKA